MYIKLRNTEDDEMIQGTVRMSKDVWQALRNHMHCTPDDEPDVIRFPYGTRLVKQGYGWYKLINYLPRQGVKKMKQAARIIRRFFEDQRKDVVAEIRRLMHQAKDADLRVVAYNSPVANVGGSEFVLVKHVNNKHSPPKQVPKPPTAPDLSKLLTKFGRKDQRV
ncbi:hypothetical protein D3C86_1380110 [compost metagenome]